MSKTQACLSVVLLLTICLLFSSNIVVAETSTIWDRTYGMHGSGHQVIKTIDGGFAVAGDTDGQLLLLKTDSEGSKQWTQTYGKGTFYSITQTADGGYALAGTGDSINFIKTDSEGNMEWSKYYANADDPFHAKSVIQTSDGGYALTGWTSTTIPSPKGDWTIKTNSQGNILWNKTYGIQSSLPSAQEILLETDGGYILAANGNLSKLDSQGNLQWTTNAVVANSLIKTSDGGYLVAAAYGGSLIKFDDQGNREWSNSYRFEGAQRSFFDSASQTSDGGYVVTGVTYPVYNGLGWVLKVDEKGAVEGEVTFPPTSGINNRIYSIIETDEGNYVFSGSKNAPNGEGLVWLAKISPSIVIPEFPSWIILPLFLLATFSAIIVKKRLFHKGS
jgi:hypothetical protein